MSFHNIRIAEKRDALKLAGIFRELGHVIESESICSRWDQWTATGNSALVAQQSDGGILGVVTLHKMIVLHRPQPVGRITLLFVDASFRGCGIGRALVNEAEEALARDGCGLMEITSHFKWVPAHAFYEQIGYNKTSLRFVKDLTGF